MNNTQPDILNPYKPAVPVYEYCRFYHPTKTLTTDKAHFTTRMDFLEKLNQWNKIGFNQGKSQGLDSPLWSYWEL